MVVKGRFSKKPPKPVIKLPKNTNKYIDSISALKKKPHQQKAIDILYEVANIVTPIMKEYGLHVKNLVEMSPKDDNLLGLNINKGYKICLRLRPPRDDDTFLSLENLVGTMLHELTHNTHSAHDSRFYAKLDELTNKMETYMLKGINGSTLESGFQGKGQQLTNNGLNKARNLQEIRDARLKRMDFKFIMGVNRLGGGSGKNDKKLDLKELVREATIRRYEDDKWCNHDHDEVNLPNDDELITIDDEEDDVQNGKMGIIDEKDNNNKRVLDLVDSKDVLPKRKKSVQERNKDKEIETIDLTSE